MSTHLVTVASVVLCTLAAVPNAQAADPAEARSLYDRGKSHFERGEFADALSAFKEAYDVDPNPAILIRVAECHEKLGDREQALFIYRRYLDEAPDGKHADRVRDDIERLERAPSGDPDDPHGEDAYDDDDDDDDYDDDYSPGHDDDDDFGGGDGDDYYDEGDRDDTRTRGGPDPAMKVWKSLRTVGMVVTFATIGLGGGIAAIFFISGSTTMGSDDDEFLAGWVSLSTGLGLSVVMGVPLWVMSAVSVGALKRRGRSAALTPWVAPTPGGAIGGFTLSF